ncbi:Gar1/Naf1 RNA binding region-domain-containing protein [Spinellus fusiger]|nr:Gar1/Naf1 RNA binding region-domain-containing protein [Spinellus fusiger]
MGSTSSIFGSSGDKLDPLDAAIAIANTNTTQNEEGYESSDLEMASDDDSDSSDSDSSDSDEDDTKELIDLEEDDEGGPKDDILKTANEITDIIIEKPIFEMTPTTEVVSVGSIFSIIDNVIVVQSHPNPILALDMGTLFIYSDRDIMGEVFETFGPIARPFYSVRYTTADDMDKEKTILGDRVFYVPSYVRSKPIEVEVLKRMKGTDASNLYDEEAGEEVGHILYTHGRTHIG